MDTVISSCLRLTPSVWVVPVAVSLQRQNQNLRTAMVTMETKALEGIGAAFPPVPPAPTLNWLLRTLLGAGAEVSRPPEGTGSSIRGKAGGQKSATILLSPAQPLSLGSDPQGSSEDLEALQESQGGCLAFALGPG